MACTGIALHLPLHYFIAKGEMCIKQCGNHLCDTTNISVKSDALTGAHVDLALQLGLLCTYYTQLQKTMKQLTKGASSRSFSKQQKITEILTAQGTEIWHLLFCYHQSTLPGYYLHFVTSNHSPPPLCM